MRLNLTVVFSASIAFLVGSRFQGEINWTDLEFLRNWAIPFTFGKDDHGESFGIERFYGFDWYVYAFPA